MKDKQKYLLMRYSSGYVRDCILQHRQVLQEKGFCWYGKIGNVPSDRILNTVFGEPEPQMVLYRKNAAYVCRMDKYSLKKPSEGTPTYYETEGIFLNIYFRLTAIDECDPIIFHDSIAVSTGTFVEDVVYHSRIPFMLCQYIDESKHELLDSRDCRYRKDEFCTCRSCVNYGCFCERPSTCKKQRR